MSGLLSLSRAQYIGAHKYFREVSHFRQKLGPDWIANQT